MDSADEEELVGIINSPLRHLKLQNDYVNTYQEGIDDIVKIIEQDDGADFVTEFDKRPSTSGCGIKRSADGNQEAKKCRKLVEEGNLYQSKEINILALQMKEANHNTEKLKEEIENLKKESRKNTEKLKEEIDILKKDSRKQKADYKNLETKCEVLEAKITTVEDAELCRICYTERKNCWLIPCRHWILCKGCYQLLQDNKFPECRQDLQGAVEFFGR
ncbi:unnamed protein product [Meganyctiphanes norvegica]|uniref:RING-type domain-containing protein n=1 Tax=Meganyctiphanes norvegica TaxID=48144 RepID=A0AAV2QWX0_MEGNR